MANKTIHELNTASTVSLSDQLALYDISENTTTKITLSDIKDTVGVADEVLIADDSGSPTGDIDFTSLDTSLTPSSTESVGLISSSDSWTNRLNKISGMFKNIRYLLNNNMENYGSPLVANLIADMTDDTKVYVYTGSETGYTAGDWYYWNGSAWVDGGVYNSVALNTDTTLSIAGEAADGKTTGDRFLDVNSTFNANNSLGSELLMSDETLAVGTFTTQGVTFTKDGYGWIVNGTSTGTVVKNIHSSSNGMLGDTQAGDKLFFDISSTNNKIYLLVTCYNSSTQATYNEYLTESTVITIPANTTKILVGIRVVAANTGTVFSNDHYSVVVRRYLTNKELENRDKELENKVDDITIPNMEDLTWEVGTINTQAGAFANSGTRVREIKYIDFSDVDSVVIATGYKATLRYYDSSYSFIGRSTGFETGTVIPGSETITGTVDNVKYIRIVAAYTSDAEIADTEPFRDAIKIIRKDLYPVKEKIDKATDVMSKHESYFDAEIATTIASVQNEQDEPCLTFFLCTDLHYGSQISSQLIKTDSVTTMTANMSAITKKIRMDGLICLGDISDGNYVSEDSLVGYNEYIMRRMRNVGVPLYFTPGNHDDWHFIYDNQAMDYNGMNRNYYRHVSNNRQADLVTYGTNYYIDYPNMKIRLIFINSTSESNSSHWGYCYSSSCRTWLTQTLSGTPSEYTVFLFSHTHPDSRINVGQQVSTGGAETKTIIDNYISGGGKFGAHLHGHSHIDMYSTVPWLSIATNCQKAQNLANDYISSENFSDLVLPTAQTWERTLGTATEDCWDVLLIKPISKTIKMIRFGAGNDRTFTWASE